MRYDIPAQTLLAVLLVVLEVALEPVHVAIAFEGEDVRADAISGDAELLPLEWHPRTFERRLIGAATNHWLHSSTSPSAVNQ